MKYIYQYSIAGTRIQIESEIRLDVARYMKPFAVENVNGAEQVRIQVITAINENFPIEKPIYEAEHIRVWKAGNSYCMGYLMNREGKSCSACIKRGQRENEYVLYADEMFCQMFREEGKIYSYIMIEQIMLLHKTFYLHASCVKYHNEAIVFSAPSGTGKSTQASLWEEHRNAQMINGDRVAIRQEEDGYYAYGSPYAGSSGIYVNDSAKIKGIILLRQGSENVIEPIEPSKAVKQLFSQCMVYIWDKDFVSQLLELLSSMVSKVPIYQLTCRPDEEAVSLVEKTLF